MGRLVAGFEALHGLWGPTSSSRSRLREHGDRFLEGVGGGRDVADVRVRQLQDEEEVGGGDDDADDDGHHRVVRDGLLDAVDDDGPEKQPTAQEDANSNSVR